MSTRDVDDAPEEKPPAADDAIPMDRLAKVYRKMQERIQQLTMEHEKALAPLQEQLDMVKNALKDKMLALGAESLRTDEGTIMLSVKTRYNAQDWAAFKEFIKQHDALDLLEKRIAQKNMGEFLAANPTAVPPGLNTFSEYSVSVRKPTA